MPFTPEFDPTLPVNNSPVASEELRNRFNGLKLFLDAVPTSQAKTDFVVANSAGNVDSVPFLNLTVSNPPTQAQVQAIANQLDNLLQILQRN